MAKYFRNIWRISEIFDVIMWNVPTNDCVLLSNKHMNVIRILITCMVEIYIDISSSTLNFWRKIRDKKNASTLKIMCMKYRKLTLLKQWNVQVVVFPFCKVLNNDGSLLKFIESVFGRCLDCASMWSSPKGIIRENSRQGLDCIAGYMNY